MLLLILLVILFSPRCSQRLRHCKSIFPRPSPQPELYVWLPGVIFTICFRMNILMRMMPTCVMVIPHWPLWLSVVIFTLQYALEDDTNLCDGSSWSPNSTYSYWYFCLSTYKHTNFDTAGQSARMGLTCVMVMPHWPLWLSVVVFTLDSITVSLFSNPNYCETSKLV